MRIVKRIWRKIKSIDTKLDEKAAISTDKIIGTAVGIYVAAAILPQALTNWFNVTTTGWSSEASTLWSVGGFLAVLGVIMLFYKRGR